jgi:hypothetical protein
MRWSIGSRRAALLEATDPVWEAIENSFTPAYINS